MDFIHPKEAEIKTKLEGRLPAILSEKSGRKNTNWSLACQIAQWWHCGVSKAMELQLPELSGDISGSEKEIWGDNSFMHAKLLQHCKQPSEDCPSLIDFDLLSS